MSLHCYRCWTVKRITNTSVITLVRGTAMCLTCVDEEQQAERAFLTQIVADRHDREVHDTAMTLGDLFTGRWSKVERQRHRKQQAGPEPGGRPAWVESAARDRQ